MNNGDPIDNLNNNIETPLSQQESYVMDTLFKPENKPKVNGNFLKQIKIIVVIIFLYILLSIPVFDKILKKFLPITENSIYMKILIKSLLFGLIWWIIMEFYLNRKNKS